MQPIHIVGGGLAGTEAAWQAARRGVPAVLYEMRPARPTPAHRPAGSPNWFAATRSRASRPPPRRGSSSRNCAAWIRCCCARPPRPAFPAAMRSRWTATRSPMRSSAPSPESRAIELRREEVASIPGGGIVVIASGPLTSPALAAEIAHLTGTQRLYFYDAISPIVEAETRRHVGGLLGLALRQVHRWHRRLPELPVRPRTVRALRGRSARGPGGAGAHRGRLDAVLRGLPAHRGTGAPRPRHAALRPHEARGTHRSAHRTPALCRGATPPGKPARPELQPCGLSEPPEVRRPGAHLAHDPRPGTRGVPALRPDPPQHLYRCAVAAHAGA